MVDFGADNPRNPRKHRRLDDDLSDGGGGPTSDTDRPAMTVLHQTPSYKESLMKDSMNGDPPDPKQQLGIGTRDSQHAPHVPGMADNSLIDSAATAVDNSLLPGGSQEQKRKITMLKTSDEAWCDDDVVLMNEAVVFFRNLFDDSNSPLEAFPVNNSFPHLPHAALQRLDSIPSNFMDGNGNWDLHLLLSIFSHTVVAHIISIKCPDASDIADKPLWRMATSHSFSICSAYESLVHSVWSDKSSCWKCIWTQPVSQRLRFFLWLSFNERLMTNVERCRRSIGAVWLTLIPSELHVNFFNSNMQIWLLTNLSTAYIHSGLGISWPIVFASTLWQLWNRRNNLVFNSLYLPAVSVYHKSVAGGRYFAESSLFSARGDSGSGTSRPVHWQRPEEDWTCLNTDGAVSTLNGFGSIGGVFCAHDGDWLLGFNKFIGFTQSLQSELWAILTGLRLARDNGYERLLIQSDNLEVITRLNATTATSDVNALVRAIVRLRNADWIMRFQWIPREANKLDDALVKLAASYDLSLFAVPPTPLQSVLDSDSSNLL
ncbi:hypothetical protein V6N11_070573 [Hibiscus sabdariffa]|uniref:RNase H type-1 domain-containing protein n=1 Tax=Hibiscus sabdariffa TaxID=183260 RepID=A0ABR2QFZ7_9ROSI